MFVQIFSYDHIVNTELRARAERSTKSKNTTQYIYHLDNKEQAFISLDRRPDINALVIYEIYVATQFRKVGVAKKILGQIESVAENEGYGSVRLVPYPLDASISAKDLISLYLSCGYHPDLDIPSEMLKEI